MAVNITYTGVNGKTTRFESSSPSMAIERLAKIPGYAATEGDAIAAGLARGWRERHKDKVARFRNRAMPFVGKTSGQKFVNGDGIVSEIPRVAGVEMDNGELVVKSRNDFVTDSGRVVGVGGENAKRIPISSLDASKIEIESGPDSNIKVTRNGNKFTIDVYYV